MPEAGQYIWSMAQPPPDTDPPTPDFTPLPGKQPSYWAALAEGIASVRKGLSLTYQHQRKRGTRRSPQAISEPGYFTDQPSRGQVTIQYPQEQLPVPDTGRYRLYMETPDCIGCDQCARICPVDCITIEKVKAVDELPPAADGTKVKFYLPTFDIDMAKCCYCGLCTVVCPTECLIMTKSYEFSTPNREELIFHFGNLTPEEAQQKQADWDAHEAEQKRLKAEALVAAKKKKEQDAARQAATSPGEGRGSSASPSDTPAT